jgi:hypothetical protein
MGQLEGQPPVVECLLSSEAYVGYGVDTSLMQRSKRTRAGMRGWPMRSAPRSPLSRSQLPWPKSAKRPIHTQWDGEFRSVVLERTLQMQRERFPRDG